MANKSFSVLSAIATQGSADAFVQVAVASGIATLSGQAIQVRKLAFELSGAVAANAAYEYSLTRKSFAAMPALSQLSLMHKRRYLTSFTTSGFALYEAIERVDFAEDELIIVEDPFYVQLDTNATTVANTLTMRMEYELVKISDADKLNLVARSLL